MKFQRESYDKFYFERITLTYLPDRACWPANESNQSPTAAYKSNEMLTERHTNTTSFERQNKYFFSRVPSKHLTCYSWFSRDVKKTLKLNILRFYLHLVKDILKIHLMACFQLGNMLCFENRAV